MRILLWLTVVPAGASTHLGGSGDLFYRWMETGALPDHEEDMLTLYITDPDDDPDDGPNWSIHRRWLRFDGTWSIDLTKMVLDPNEQIRRYLQTDRSRYYARPWWTDQSGDPRPRLLACGWRKYEGTIEP